MLTMGVDIGSLLSKVAVLDGDRLVASGMMETTGNIAGEIHGLISSVLEGEGIEAGSVKAVAGTGSGSEALRRTDLVEDEVTCAAAAAAYMLPEISMVVDIGGQSITSILLDEDGDVVNFMRNDKCASGSGRFLEVMSSAVGFGVEEIDDTVAGAGKPVQISSQCGVFAESEVITHVNEGEAPADIVAGLCIAVSSIVAAQARRFGDPGKYTLTGGVARIESVNRLVREKLGGEYQRFPHDPRLATAIGAALLAGIE